MSRCYFGTSRLALRAELARRILPVPEALVFEADEYLFSMAAALAGDAELVQKGEGERGAGAGFVKVEVPEEEKSEWGG